MLYNKNMQNIRNSYLKLKIIGNVCSDFNKLVIHDWRKKLGKYKILITNNLLAEP